LKPGVVAVERTGNPTGLGFGATLARTAGATFGAVSNPLRAPLDVVDVVFELRVALVFVVLVCLSWFNVGLLFCADASVASTTEKIAADAARHKCW
jgi:hypothetical protein